MSKLTLSNLANLENASTAVGTINANNALIETALDNTLSRDGTSPNSMNADLDMDSHHILNLPAPVNATDPVRLSDLTSVLSNNLGSYTVLDEDTLASDSSLVVPTQHNVKTYVDTNLASTTSSIETTVEAFSNAPYVSTRTALSTLDGTLHPIAYLTEAGREGVFVWNSSDMSAHVTADPSDGTYTGLGQGIYIAPASHTTGSNGCWVRKYNGLADVRWWGMKADASTDNSTCYNQYLIPALNAGVMHSLFFKNIDNGIYVINTVSAKITASDVIITSDQAELQKNSGTDGTFFKVGDYNNTTPNRRVYISNFNLLCLGTGSGTNVPGSPCFAVDNCSDWDIRNIYLNKVGAFARIGYGDGTVGNLKNDAPNGMISGIVGSLVDTPSQPVLALYSGSNFKFNNYQITSPGRSSSYGIYIKSNNALDTIRISDGAINTDVMEYAMYINSTDKAVTNVWCSGVTFANSRQAAIGIIATGSTNTWTRHIKFINCYILGYGGKCFNINNTASATDIEHIQIMNCTMGYTGSGGAIVTNNTSTGTVTGLSVIGNDIDDLPMYLSSATQTNPVVVTMSHYYKLNNGDTVLFNSCPMTQLNGNSYTVANFNDTAGTFELSGIDGTAFTAWTSGSGYGIVQKSAAITLGVSNAKIIGNHFGRFLNDVPGNTVNAVKTSADIDYFSVVGNEIAEPTALRSEHSYATWSNNRIWEGNFGSGANTPTTSSLPQYVSGAPPSATTGQRAVFTNVNSNNAMAYYDSTPAAWKLVGDVEQTISTNANATLVVLTNGNIIKHTGTLTADRTLALDTTAGRVYPGAKFRITRTGSGAFNLSVGGLKNLVQNTWCEVVYDGSAWYLSAYGAL